MQPEYEVKRNEEGRFLAILRNSDNLRIVKDPNHAEYQEFLTWNRQRKEPLEIADQILVPGDHCFLTDQELVEHCKCHGTMLFVYADELSYAGSENFPDGTYDQLFTATMSSETSGTDTLPRKRSGLWLHSDFYAKVQQDIKNEDAPIRKVSSWTVVRTFIYVDISDFSKYAAGEQALIIRSLIGLVNMQSYWSDAELYRSFEAMFCIGDGYIFAFKQPVIATHFAAYLAHLIDVLVARKRLPVTFHFRMGAHVGDVYSFWDPGRNGWNYIGDGINGGNRVLAAGGKEKDDALFISAELRHALIDSGNAFPISPRILSELQNRGRMADKHGNPWRVYELNHTALCEKVLPLDLQV